MNAANPPSDAPGSPDDASREARLDALGQTWLERLRAGEAVSAEAYAEAHPDLAEDILETFPVLALMEGLKPAPPAPAPTELSASTPPTAPTATLPAEIDGHRVLGELGRGGMGRVYEVRTPAGARAALKLVHPHLLDRPGILARFLRELDTGLRLDHPAVVRTLASGTAVVDGRELPYLVLEFIEGETLRDLLQDSGRVSERLAREIGLALSEALEAIHAAGIVHRDIKPENVVIAPDERITLMDLGVALVKEEALRLTQTGEFVGSLLYAAPEQLRSREVDGRTDLYGLGLLLFELVAGRHPEAAGGGSVLTRRFGQARAPRLRSVVPQTTAFFDRVVQTLLATDPEERFADAATLRRVLEEGERGTWWLQEQERVRRNERPRRFADAVPLTGRDATLAELDACLDEVEGGQGRVLVLRGEAGLGKSHLLSTWLDRIESDDPDRSILYLEYAPGAGAMGLTPIAAALRPHLRDIPLERLQSWMGMQGEHAASFRAAIGLGEAGIPARTTLDRSTLELYAVLVTRALSQDAVAIVVMEDLHFASAEGQELFGRLANVFREDAVLVVGTTRPVDPPIPNPALLRLEHLRVVDLPRLVQHDALRLLSLVLGTDPTQPEVIDRLIQKSDGNPYCLLEFARALRDTSRDDRLMRDDVDLPGSVRQLVEERLAALESADRELLELAACDGYRFDPVSVCEAAGLPRIAGLRTLHRLERERGLITAEGARYRFHHHLVQESLRAALPSPLLAAYHAALGDTLQARIDGRSPRAEESYALARHYLLGERPEQARPYVEAGLEYLVSLSEFRRAGRMAERALEMITDLPAGLRARLRVRYGHSVRERATPEEFLAIIEVAVEEARASGDVGLLIDTLDDLSGAVSQTGRHREGCEVVAEARRLAEASGDPIRHARTLAVDAMAAFDLGEPERALAQAKQALGMAREAGDHLLTARTALYLASLALEIEGTQAALPRAEMALAAGQLHGDGTLMMNALSVLGRIANTRGRPREASDLLLRAKALARDLGRMRRMMLTHGGLSEAALNAGDTGAALRLAQEGLDVSERLSWREYFILTSVPCINIHSAEGRFAEARELADRAVDTLEHVPLPAIALRLLPTVARHHAWCGRFERADETLDRADSCLAQVTAPRELLLVAQARAGLLDARGETEAALAAYREILPQAEALHLDLVARLLQGRIAGLCVCLDRAAEVVSDLEALISVARQDGLRALEVEAEAWLALAEGAPERGRDMLADEARPFPAWAALRLATQVLRMTGDATDRDALVGRLDAMRGALPGDCQQSFAQVGPVRQALSLIIGS